MSSMSLNDLTDVTISNPTIDQKIAYDGSQWVNYYAKVLLTYDTFFQGKTITITKGGSSSTVTLPLNETEAMLLVPSKGEYGITYTESVHTYSASVDAVSSGELYYATLEAKDTINVTLYSAMGDTLTYTDADGVEKTVVFDDDSASKVVTLAIIPSGISITFNSTGAYDVDDYYERTYNNNYIIQVLNFNYYSKTVTVNKNTTEIYVMPEGALYWFGWKSDEIESCIPANGWTLDGVISGLSLEAPTYVKRGISTKYATSEDKFHGAGTKNPISNKSSVVVVTTYMDSRQSGNYANIISSKRIGGSNLDNVLVTGQVGSIDVTGLRNELDVTGLSNFYITCYSGVKAWIFVSAIVVRD